MELANWYTMGCTTTNHRTMVGGSAESVTVARTLGANGPAQVVVFGNKLIHEQSSFYHT